MPAQKWTDIKRKAEKPKATIKIFLDDVRQPYEVYENGGSWMLCRDIESCQRFLAMGIVSHISLDGDMGKIGDKDIPGGIELIDWMRESGHWPTINCLVHSQNPVKATQMRMLISQHFISEEDLKEYNPDDIKNTRETPFK